MSKVEFLAVGGWQKSFVSDHLKQCSSQKDVEAWGFHKQPGCGLKDTHHRMNKLSLRDFSEWDEQSLGQIGLIAEILRRSDSVF